MFSACAKRGAAFAAAAFLLLAGCGADPQSPEQRISAVIDAVEQAVEAGSVKGVAEFLHAEYADEWHADPSAALRSLFGYLRRHSDIYLFTSIRSVEISQQQDAADVVVLVAMTRLPADTLETLIALKADLYRFEVHMTLLDDQWRVRRSRWQRADFGSL